MSFNDRDGFYSSDIDYYYRRNPAFALKEQLYQVLRDNRCDMTEQGIVRAIREGQGADLVARIAALTSGGKAELGRILPSSVASAILSYGHGTDSQKSA